MRGEGYLEVALDAARWVVGSTVPADGCLALPAVDDFDEKGKVDDAGAPVADNFYNGTAGVLAMAAEACLAGVRLPVDGVRDRLLARVDSTDDVGLYQGIAGYGAVLLGYAEATGDPAARAGVDVAVGRLGTAWTERGWPSPSRYPKPGVFLDVISGAAGIALFLVRVGTPEALELAGRAADLLLAHGEPTAAGLDWPATPGQQPRMPNFSHGTAGTATALAAVGRATGRRELVAAAECGADHLRSMAVPGVGFVVPNVVPAEDGGEPVSYGWCHGPAGTARLFWAIGDADTADAGLLAIRSSGIPRRLRPGFWDNLGRCCGSAGVAEVMLDAHQRADRPDLLAFADVLAEDLVARATTDAAGTRWSFVEHDAETGRSGPLPPEPGWMHGAAGIAASLFRLHRVHRDGRGAARVDWPDTPAFID